MFGRAAVGAGVLATCLQAGAASALSFNFTFTGGAGAPAAPVTVTGVVDGLVDNLNDQKTGLTVTVTSATNSGSLPDVFTDALYSKGSGFDVSGGQVIGVDIAYGSSLTAFIELANNSAPGSKNGYSGNSFGANFQFDNSPSTTLSFTPIAGSASVPGPLPLFGAGAAFCWSRRLRRKIKATI